ncbi:hypothetical protein PSHT_07908 [Puccinia striiformis]|uniref:Uncharacterized protein n=1 Tax=Puccinia striiformis TaxID=27350 RepID=A0A2S4VU01_9BASI|nr:hypothetical protein PSHT_07908 [Puccinia striiformis]
MIHTEAPHWPLFLLQETLSDPEYWESEIQVWNMEQFQGSITLIIVLDIPRFPWPPHALGLILSYLKSPLSRLKRFQPTIALRDPTSTNPPARCILASSKLIDTPNSNSRDQLNSNLMPSAIPELWHY